MQIWKRIIRIMWRIGMDGIFSWGMVVWSSFTPQTILYDSSMESVVIMVYGSRILTLPLHPFSSQEIQEEEL